ncbi:MAG TPA: hypothetical protein VJN18_32395 [Polyangiaceae bacterium]|nr:hypothetical protein [Polyangiaceae bacterium]
MSTAYIVALIDTTQTPPVVVGAGIFSDGRTLTTDLRRAFPVEIQEFKAETFQEAYEQARDTVEKYPPFAWLKPLMSREDFEPPKLWAVHVQGPGTVIAQPNRECADRRAKHWNAVIEHRMSKDPSPNDPVVRCEVIEWPHSAAGHAEELAKHGGYPEDIC